MMANEHIRTGSNSYEKVKTFKYLGSLLINQNSIQEKIKCGLKTRNSCYNSVQTLLSSRLLLKNLKIKIYKINIASFAIWMWNMAPWIAGYIQKIPNFYFYYILFVFKLYQITGEHRTGNFFVYMFTPINYEDRTVSSCPNSDSEC